MPRWVTPVDPECPVVAETHRMDDEDPISRIAPMDEINEAFERNHLGSCKRCQEYGAANIDVEY
jgi:hypothetical protein